jgi:putative ABC transport system substrate-binding protein
MMSLRRRDFIVGLGSAAAWPLAAQAQRGERMRRVGILQTGSRNGNIWLALAKGSCRPRLEGGSKHPVSAALGSGNADLLPVYAAEIP